MSNGPTTTKVFETERDYSLDVLRIVAIIGVVAIHVIGLVLGNVSLTGSAEWWGAVVLDIGFIWVVPVFIMISGALTLRERAHVNGPKEFYQKRISRILPALIVWHVVYIVIFRVIVDGEKLVSKGVLVTLLDAKPFTALYFLWLILGLYLVSPIFAAFLHQGDRKRWIITGLVATAWGFLIYLLPAVYVFLGVERSFSLNVLNYFIPFLGYYLMGFALYKVVISHGITTFVSIVVLTALTYAIVAWGLQRQGVDFGPLGILNRPNEVSLGIFLAACGIFLVVQNTKVLVSPPQWLRPWIIRLSNAAFGVFLIHLLFLRLLYFVVPQEMIQASLLNAILAFLVVVVLSFSSVLFILKIPFLRRTVS